MVVSGAWLLAARGRLHSRVCTFVRPAETRQYCARSERTTCCLLPSNYRRPTSHIRCPFTVFCSKKRLSAEPGDRGSHVAMGKHGAHPPARWGAFRLWPDGFWLCHVVVGQNRFWQPVRPLHTPHSDAWPHRNGDRYSNCICCIFLWNF